MAEALQGFTEDRFTSAGKTRTVWRTGSGPAVLVLAEVPGPTPWVLDFARRVAAEGCTAVVPVLFGVAGKPPSVPYGLQTLAWSCISKEFTLFARGRTSSVTDWLRALGRSEHERCGGPGIGVVGMCLTGGFALAMLADEAVLAPVLSQPSLPLSLSKGHRADLGVDDATWAAGRQRVLDEDLCVLGLRFTDDKLCPEERFAHLRRELGDNFVGVSIDSSPGNPHGIPAKAHSVLTEHLVETEGHPTMDALEQVLELVRSRLLVAGGPSGRTSSG